MARILWLADALRNQPGLRVVEVAGWRDRGLSTLVSPLHGVMFHHTASPLTQSDEPALRVVTFGRTGLPGPIANVMVGRDGTAYVIASGKANHAGLGGPWRTVPTNDGNRHLFSVEVVNNGIGEPWNDTVLSAVDRVFAAVLKRIGKDASWCVGHKEWAPTRKIDPSLNMDAYRSRLRAFMEGDDELAILTDEEQLELRNFLANLKERLDARAGGAGNRVGNAVLKVEKGIDGTVPEHDHLHRHIVTGTAT